MGLELKERARLVSDIIADHCTTLGCNDEIVLLGGMPITAFQVLNFLLETILKWVLTEWTDSHIDDIEYAIVASSQQYLLVFIAPADKLDFVFVQVVQTGLAGQFIQVPYLDSRVS